MQIISKPSHKLICVVATATLLTSAIFYGIFQTGLLTTSEPAVVQAPPAVKKVTALGRLEPQGEVINLSAPLV